MEIDVSRYASIPFVEKGRDITGCDCWGIVFLIFRDFFDIELPTYLEDYTSTEDEKVLGAVIAEHKRFNWEEVFIPEQFDVVLFRLKGQPMHVGVYVGEGRFVHCIQKSGVSVEKVNSIVWRNRIVGYYRYTR